MSNTAGTDKIALNSNIGLISSSTLVEVSVSSLDTEGGELVD